jgi:lipopolysaccharide export system permease protein
VCFKKEFYLFMIFRRSLLRELFSTSSAIFIALLTIVLTIALVRFLGQAANGQVDNQAVVALISFAALNNLPVLLQLTTFITVLLVLTRSYRDSEMVVWQSSGLGLTSWLRPILQFAVPIALIVAVLSLAVAPWANLQSSEFKARFEQRTDVTRVAPGQFIESTDGAKVIFVEGLKQGTTNVSNVFVSSFQHDKQSVMVSATGEMERQPNGQDFIVLKKGRRYEGSPKEPDYKVMEFERYGLRVDPQPPDFSSDDSTKIKATMDLIQEGSARDLGELVWRLGLPLSVVCLALLAIPMSFINPRAGRSANLMIALLIYFIYTNGMNIVQTNTGLGRIRFEVAVWIVHGIVLVIALLMLRWRSGVHRSMLAWLSQFKPGKS